MVTFDSLLFRSLATISLFCILAGALWAAEAVLVPITIALFLALVLHLPIQAAENRGVPRLVSTLILGAVLAISAVAFQQYGIKPAQELIKQYPEIRTDLTNKIAKLRLDMIDADETGNMIREAAEDVSQIVEDTEVEEVVVRESSLLTRAATTLARAMSSFAVVVVLTGFILVSRQPFLSLATMFFIRPSEKLHAARIWTRVEDQVSRYFLTITAINIALGTTVGTMLALYGMPYATLWGVLVTLFNFIPFVGPAIGMVILAAVSLVTFDSIWVAAVPPLIYFGINFIEANVVTPQAIGQHLRISPVAILVSLMFWGWIWGFAGLLISVPFLVVLKSIADQTPRLAMINRIVSRRANLRNNS